LNDVQESNGTWLPGGWGSALMLDGNDPGNPPQLDCQFTHWYVVNSINSGGDFQDYWAYGTTSLSDCEFYGYSLSCYEQSSVAFTNCLFVREGTFFWDQSAVPNITLLNCTFYNGGLSLYRTGGASGESSAFWTIENTTFDGTAIITQDDYSGTTNTLFNYNAYNSGNTNWEGYDFGVGISSTGTLEVVGPNDVTVTNGYNWQSSWFGNYYLPTNSLLLNKGSTNASLLGLYHFTITTNQVVEGTNIVSIGYHYVATDTNGIPLDTNGDGVPDYIEDANGNGLVDSGEIGWNTSSSQGFKVFIIRPKNGSTLP
jgi:hypothetical protein